MMMARKINRKFWFLVHGWLSLPVWIIFSFVCLTGTIAVLSHEITWLTNPNARAVNPLNEDLKPIGLLVDNVKRAYPTADVNWVMTRESYLTHVVSFTDADKPAAMAYVNQYTGEIQEVYEGLSFIGFMRSLHGWLLFPWHHNFSVGYYLVSIMAIVMLGALITGLMVYKKFWRAFYKPTLRVNKGKRIFLQDIHRLTGVWSIWFLFVISLTGLWYLTQAILWHNNVEIEPHPHLLSDQNIPSYQAHGPEFTVSIDQALAAAQQSLEDFRPTMVMLPEHNRDSYHLSGTGDFILFDNYSYKLAVDPWQGNVEISTTPETMSALQTLTHTMDPLHYGTIGGIWTKILWFLFGLMLSAMSIVGFFIWRLRLIAVKKETLTTASLQEAN